MKKRIGIAFAGAALAAGVVGGAGFAVTPTVPTVCDRLQRTEDLLTNAENIATSLGATKKADALAARIAVVEAKEAAVPC